MSFSPFNWIRDALGIHKDAVELEKARLEIRKLEMELERLQAAQSAITKATPADIEKYDKKVAHIINNSCYYMSAFHSFDDKAIVSEIYNELLIKFETFFLDSSELPQSLPYKMTKDRFIGIREQVKKNARVKTQKRNLGKSIKRTGKKHF